jgi:D-alanyl-lipoteichoic acid acyltransferase DltB (MBOAT superfamily)
MIFNSFSYLIFLGIIAALYWYLPRTPRLWLLFIASLVFYGFWNYLFIAILLFSVGFDYFAALWIASLRDERMRKMVLVASLAVNLGILGFFKYAIFVLGQVEGFARLLGLEISGFSLPFHVILPIGISFYTFHSMSYTIDVWRRRIEPKRNFILFATFVVFFPQLVAGPILRAAEVIP